jgi:ElaB/YqjD/DUF883 family membrane-anchored ribosome-binding protein
MSDTSSGATATENEKSQVAESVNRALDEWRTRIDELKVQVDLAKLDVRDRATKQLEVAQNVCLAAFSMLSDARHDAAVSADTLREGIEQLLHDVKRAFEAAQAVVDRG